MRIDVHSHYLPPGFFDLMEHADAAHLLESYSVFGQMLRPGAVELFAPGPAAVIDGWSVQMQESAVDLAVMSLGALQPYFAQRSTAREVTRRANDLLASAVDIGHGRLAAFASLPLPHVEDALAEATYWLDQDGFVGINLGTSVDGRPLDSPEFEPLWALLDDRRTTVFIHPGATPLMGVGSTEFHLAPDFCSPTETALALLRLITGRVTSRYPRIRFIAAAMGGSLPYFAHRFDTGLAKSHPELYEEIGGVLLHLRRCWYDTSMLDEPRALDSVRHSLGVDRLVFGSDLPRGPLSEALGFVASSSLLSDAEKTQILDVNGAAALAGAREVAIQ